MLNWFQDGKSEFEQQAALQKPHSHSANQSLTHTFKLAKTRNNRGATRLLEFLLRFFTLGERSDAAVLLSSSMQGRNLPIAIIEAEAECLFLRLNANIFVIMQLHCH